MIVSPGFLAIMISVALAVTIITPIILIIFWIKDCKEGQLW